MKTILVIVAAIGCLSPLAAIAQSADRNYILTRTYTSASTGKI